MAAGGDDAPPNEQREGLGVAGEGEADGAGDPENFDDEEEGGEDNDDDDDDGVVWEELYACPLTVRFTQDKVHPFFYRRGPIKDCVPKIHCRPYLGGDAEPVGVSPVEAARGTLSELVPPFGPIQCLRKGKHLWSLDNRRLFALQNRAMELWPRQCCVKLTYSDRLPRKKFKTQYRKFKTQSEGQIVHLASRYQHFETWSWREQAVETEWCDINHQLGVILSAFEMLPVIGALLFRTGLTGLTSRVPLIAAFVMTFALDVIRQKVPAFEKKISELHVKAIMDGDIKYFPSCRRNAEEPRYSHGGYGDAGHSVSAPQLASMMALLMILTLPYVVAIPHDKIRSSVFSCWLGISCVLVVQLTGIVRAGTQPEALTNSSTDIDAEDEHRLPKASRKESEGISPKHRD